MASITTIKNEREFYRDFGTLVNVLKTIAISQFHALERKIQTYDELNEFVEDFLSMMNLESVQHPFVRPREDAPLGIIAVTSDRGLLGGLNHKVMTSAFGHIKDPHSNQLVIIGQQGKNFVHGLNIFFKAFVIGEDRNQYMTALKLRDYIFGEVLAGRMGAVKILYPFASSIQVQNVMEVDLLPCTYWIAGRESQWDPFGGDILLESYPQHLVEYLVYLSMTQKFFEIFQFARLAEFAARTIHLEESSEKIKDIDQGLKLKYFRARHESIDQQMRELFAARSLYAEQDG
mgnify:CR=1 FL=1